MLSDKILAGEELTYEELTTLYAIMWDDDAIEFVDDLDDGETGQVIFKINDTLYAIDWELKEELAVTSQPYVAQKRMMLIEVPQYVPADITICRLPRSQESQGG